MRCHTSGTTVQSWVTGKPFPYTAFGFIAPRTGVAVQAARISSSCWKRKSDIVQAFHQAVSLKLLNCELGREAFVIRNQSTLKIDSQLISLHFARPSDNRGYVRFVESDGQQTILEAVVGKDVSERRRDNGTKTVVGQGLMARARAMSHSQNSCR